MLKIVSVVAIAAMAVVSSYSAASAGQCPPAPAVNERVFTLTGTPDPSCHSYGPGNDFNPGGVPAGYTLIEKDEANSAAGFLTLTGVGATSGTWGVQNVTLFTNLILLLKSGEGQSDPDWAAFLLNGATGGTWQIVSPTTGQQSLSHASLYGIPRDPQNPPVVPLPGPVWMLLATLASLGIYGWYRRRVAV